MSDNTKAKSSITQVAPRSLTSIKAFHRVLNASYAPSNTSIEFSPNKEARINLLDGLVWHVMEGAYEGERGSLRITNPNSVAFQSIIMNAIYASNLTLPPTTWQLAIADLIFLSDIGWVVHYISFFGTNELTPATKEVPPTGNNSIPISIRDISGGPSLILSLSVTSG